MTDWNRLSQIVGRAMKTTGVPGVAVGIFYKGEIVTASFGVTNVNHPLPVTEETLFQIGSIAKTFTCLAIMRLVEMGKLNLDTTVCTYWPGFKVADETASFQRIILFFCVQDSVCQTRSSNTISCCNKRTETLLSLFFSKKR